MRKYMRQMARYNMERAGLSKVNKKQADGRSYFSKHWREFYR